ncbi:MAG: L-histidine N(alpha)-methyltransferase [Deltaproteobacteria bacterium]|nr:L-histidine N(alpha)-methyltransferase [Deltaproteobacteria bacterium]MBF0525704.1 L-histidine N(alpha)-methyltransferase [Deltaproteobacteria bacterium]
MYPSSALVESYARNRFEEQAVNTMAQDVPKGLLADQKYIPSKYFYDARGSKLFEEICGLPEYYPTRTELGLLYGHAQDIVRGFRQGDLVELGAGADWKIRPLLDALGPWRRADVRYVPVDVCGPALLESAARLTAVYPEMRVNGMVADFTCGLHKLQSDRPKVVLFFGSTIGNLDEGEALAFLQDVAAMLNPGDRFILGLDMVKPVEILEAAYNDSRNVTAEFNKNILRVVNRGLRAAFNPAGFDHAAFFNKSQERVEMHLRARRDMCVEIQDLNISVTLKKDETILTEICRKFSRDGAEKMIRDAGLEVSRWYSDPKGWFSILEAVPGRPRPRE